MYNPLEDAVPDRPLLRVHAFAKDLAFGAVEGLWSPDYSVESNLLDHDKWTPHDGQDNFSQLTAKWKEAAPRASLLLAFQYVERTETPGHETAYVLTPKAFDLLEQAAPASIFISYRRRESSAFAMLLLARLKAVGLAPFLDMQDLEPGEEWHARLKDEIVQRDYCVALVGPTTLDSTPVRNEIVWAQQAEAVIIPVWHNRMSPKIWEQTREDYPELEPFCRKQAIVVEPESPAGYENAVTQILNRFGYTP